MPKSTKQTNTGNGKAKSGRSVAKKTATRVAHIPAKSVRGGSKLDQIVTLMRRPSGATLEQMVTATRWQAHSVRGAISGSLKKKLGLAVESKKTGDRRVYRIVAA